MPVWNIQLDNGDIAQVEADNEPTKEEVMQYIQNEPAEDDKSFNAPDFFPEYNDFGQELAKKSNYLGKFKDADELKGWSGDMTALYSGALRGATYSLSDLLASGIAPEELETWDIARKANPNYATTGEILGLLANAYFTKGMGIPVMAGAAKGLGAGLAVKAGGGKTAQWAAGAVAKSAVEGASIVATTDVMKTVDAMAGTESWDNARRSWENFGKDTLYATGLAFAAGEIIAPSLKYALSPAYRAMQLIGTDVLNEGRLTYQTLRALGKSAQQAAQEASAKMFSMMPPETVDRIMKIAAKDATFAQILNEQIVGNTDKIFLNTQRALTGAQTAEYSRVLNERLYGPKYRNQLGATSPDFSVGGVLHSMGISVDPSNPSKFLFTEQGALVRDQALKNAQEHVFSEVSNKGVWAGRTKMAELGNDFLSKMSPEHKDAFLTKMAEHVEDQLAKRATPEATAKATKVLKGKLDDITMELLEKNPQLAPDRARFEAAKTYVKNLMETGTDDVFEIDALRGSIKTIFKKEAEEGMATTLGAFETRIINDVLDNPAIVGKNAEGLFMTNQSLRWGEKVLDVFDMANKFTSDMADLSLASGSAAAKKQAAASLESVLSYLNQGTNAENTVARKALFKGAIANRFARAVNEGNTTEASLIRKWTAKDGELVKNNIFRPGEFDSYYKKMIPQLKAEKNIKAIIKATNPQQFAENPNIAEGLANTGAAMATSGMTANSVRIGISNAWQRLKFGGPETAKLVGEYLQNPSWANFNTMIAATKDATSKHLMQNMIMEGIKNAINTQQTLVDRSLMATEIELMK